MKLVIVLFLLFIPKVYAFNYEKCTGTGWSGSGVDLTSSSIQFTSSWGQCAAIGVVEQKKEFLAINYEKLKIDASRGAGECINSYGILSECSLVGSIELGVQM